jgi:hypothetical protein
MPFDFLSHAVPSSEPCTPEIKIIDATLALLGPHGERWIKGVMQSGDRHCLVGALYQATQDLHLTTLRTAVVFRIRAALPVEHYVHGDSSGSLMHFNDECGRRFEEIKALLLRARHAAVADAWAHHARESALILA